MSEESNKSISSRFLNELWNKKNASIIDKLIDAEYFDHTRPAYDTDIEVQGPEALKKTFAAIQAGFFDIGVSIQDQICEDNKVVTTMIWECTLKSADVPPVASQHASIMGIGIDRFKKGKIVENWNTLDVLYRLINLLELGDPQLDPNIPAPSHDCPKDPCGPGYVCVKGKCY